MMSLLPSLAAFQVSDSDAAAAGIAGLGCLAIALFSLLGLAILAFMIYCWWRICSKAGYSGAMSLLLLIPGIGPLILILILAFGEWPVSKNR
jgi:hypothetical protein